MDSRHPGEAMGGVIIQDVIVIESVHEHSPTGEFGQDIRGKSELRIKADASYRINQKITALVNYAADIHIRNNCDATGNLIHTNNITRLLTNEFFFYSACPLSLDIFETILQEVYDEAKNLPENLHLLLGTFAVEDDNKVMNVAVKIECGNYPDIKLIVKRNPSDIDPNYHTVSQSGTMHDYKQNHSESDSLIPTQNKIYIFDSESMEQIKLSFLHYNTFCSETAGGIPFYYAVEICLDHTLGCAMREFIQAAAISSTTLPPITLSSHVVLSNTSGKIGNHVLGSFVQADPYESDTAIMMPEKIIPIDNLGFGNPGKIVITKAVQCQPLSHYQQYIQKHAKRLFELLGITSYHHIPSSLLSLAVKRKNYELVEELIHAGALIIETRNHEGDTLLHAAVKQQDTDLIHLLLSHETNIHAIHPELHTTPLDYAIQNNLLSLAEQLLSRHLNNNKNQQALSESLMIAVKNGNQAMCELLLAKGANPNIIYPNSDPPLILAIEVNNPSMVNFLLENGADPDCVDQAGQPALSCAIKRDPHNPATYEIIELLLAKGADPDKKDKHGISPLDHARKYGMPTLHELLDHHSLAGLPDFPETDAQPSKLSTHPNALFSPTQENKKMETPAKSASPLVSPIKSPQNDNKP